MKANAASDSKVMRIGTAADLAEFRDGINNGTISNDINVELTSDIDLKNVNWEPIVGAKSGNTYLLYKGHFNGMGHTIKGLNVTKVVSADLMPEAIFAGSGLFAFVGDYALANPESEDLVYVSDLRVEGSVNVTGAQPYFSVAIGGIVGQAIGGGLSGCTANVDLNTEISGFNGGVLCGGVAGSVLTANVTDCVNEGSVTVSADKGDSEGTTVLVGGVVGGGNLFLTNCINRGEVVSAGSGANVGGLVALNGEGEYRNALNLGNVKAGKDSFVGGICNDEHGYTAQNVLNLGVITAEEGSYLGGITSGVDGSARRELAMYNCVNLGEVRPVPGEEGKAGSIIGIWIPVKDRNKKIINCAYVKSGDQKPISTISPDTVVPESKDLLVLPEASKDMAIVTLSVVPQVLRLAPGETGSFDIMFNDRPATSDEVGRYIESLDITAVSSEIAEISADGAHLIVTAKKDGFTNAKLKGWFHAASFAEGANFAPLSVDVNVDELIRSADIGMGILVETKKAPESPSGSGCSAGFAALALLAVIPVVLKRKK